MGEKKARSAEELLEEIFSYMNRLVNERRFSKTILLITDLGRTLTNSDRASFWYWDKKKKRYWTLAASNSGKIIVPEGTGVIGVTMANKETIIINNPYEDQRFNSAVDQKTGYVTKSILCIPVTNEKGDVIGAFQAINKIDEDGKGFDETDVKRLAMVAAYCNKTLESHLLLEEVLEDSLTGLKNRRGFFDFYNSQVKKSNTLCPTALVMCDIDFFKKVNDTYGHNAGDAVLVHIADIFRKNLMEGDEVVRWGGEEFVFLLADRTMEEAKQFAEEVRQQVQASVCIYDNTRIKVTMSFGISPINLSRAADENVKQADVCLYKAKENGRNQVVCV
ncbi:MAG: sensor domain-containing diguanylate cyclase [Lachnospiraceae bacterium]|nr:sensor domain-containing diguanylate cyclase [Lachnospiraceae bacterium]